MLGERDGFPVACQDGVAEWPGELFEHARPAQERQIAGRQVRESSFLGLGVAVPGPVDTVSGTVLDPPLMSVLRDVQRLGIGV